MRKQKIETAQYIDGNYVFEERRKGKYLFGSFGAALTTLMPSLVYADSGDVGKTFGNVHTAVLNAVDSGVVLVIIFAGASWMLGQRSRAIEILIGVACGYLIISHSINLRDFLKSI